MTDDEFEETATALVEARMALYGYTAEQVVAAGAMTHEAAGCFYENWNWVCHDENDRPNHPDWDELEETAEFVCWVLENMPASTAAVETSDETTGVSA